jgi:hypothetical protein
MSIMREIPDSQWKSLMAVAFTLTASMILAPAQKTGPD